MRSLLSALLLCRAVWAHDEAGVHIEDLNERIAQLPEFPELYFQRGVEYLAMQDLEKARGDFLKALSLRADYLPATRSLAMVTFRLNDAPKALQILRDGIAQAPPAHAFLLPGCRQLEGEILLTQNKPTEALQALDLATKSDFPDVDTWRLRAVAQRRLGKHAECISDLKNAWQKSHAIILRNEWIDASISLGHIEEVLSIVEKELAESKWRSSWLIRRARIHLKSNRPTEANADLTAAVEELNQRLSSPTPPYVLLCDRGLAHALLNEKTLADSDLKRAKDLGAPAIACRLLEESLGNR